MHPTFAKKNSNLYAKWLPFATYIIPASSLAPRDRQILILRCASWSAVQCATRAPWQAPKLRRTAC
jgi:hypothetical protein